MVINYKTTKTMKKIDSEACHSKHQDILDKYKEMYPTTGDAEKLGKDFPHNKEDITKLIVTSKLKSVFELYTEKQWTLAEEVVMAELFYYTLSYANKSGAAPLAKVMVSSDIETTDMVVVIDDNDNVNEDAGDGDVVDHISQPGISTTFPSFFIFRQSLRKFQKLK